MFSYRLTGLGRYADAPIDYDFGVEAPDERFYIAPAFTWRPGDDTTLTLLGHYLNDEVGQENSYRLPDGTLTHISLAQPGLAEWNQEQFAIGYLFEHRFFDGLQFRQNARYSEMESHMLGVYQPYPLLDEDPTAITRFTDGNDEHRRDFVIDNQLQFDFATGPVAHTALAGFEFRDTTDWIAFTGGEAPPLDLTDPDYDQDFPPASPYLQNEYSDRSYGLYLQDQITVLDRWIVTLGGRQDWLSTTDVDELYGSPTVEADYSEFTYRAGLTYLTDFGLAPYASYNSPSCRRGATSFPPRASNTRSG